jgi:hypothetical protein
MNLHLLIPSLFWPEDSLPEIYSDLPLPALETLLARSLRTEDESQGVEAWLCRAFGVAKQQDWPVAPITLLADGAGQVKAENYYWLRADPVHLRIEHNQIVLADSRIFRVTSEEANQLTDLLNRHFTADDCDLPLRNPETARQKLVFLPLYPDRWYLRVAKTPVLQTHALSAAVSRNINTLLPSGTDNMLWQGYFNEIQMLLYEHPLNQAREARGELAINGIWLWGGGIMPQPVCCPYTQVWSNAILPRSLALAHATDHAALPPTAIAWRHSATAGNQLAVLDALQEKTQYDDVYGWRESLKKLEQDWFAPLLAALKQGRLDRLTLTTFSEYGSKDFTLTRDDLWKFWRTVKPLSTYAA